METTKFHLTFKILSLIDIFSDSITQSVLQEVAGYTYTYIHYIKNKSSENKATVKDFRWVVNH